MLRGVGTVVAAALIAVALVAIIVFAYYMLDLLRSYQTSLAEIAGTKAAASLLAGGVTGWYLDSTTTLRIHLESSNPYTILVTTVSILWSDSTYTVYDPRNTPTASFTATVDTGAASYTVDQLPIAMGPGYTVDIYIDKTVLGKTGVDVKTVSVTLSASPVVAVVPLKDYYQLYPNATTVAANATQPPAASLYALLASAPGDYTKTWRGETVAAIPVSLYGNVTDYTVETGALVSGAASSLQAAGDGDTMTVEAEKSIVVDAITVGDNLVYAEDFNTRDVFAAGAWATVGGNWSWGPGYGYDGTPGINQSDTTAEGGVGGEYIAYTNEEPAPANAAYYILAHVKTGNIRFEDTYHDIILYDPGTGFLYTYSLYVRQGGGTARYLEIWIYDPNNGWTLLNYTAATITLDTWYTALVHYDPATGWMNFTAIDEAGNWWSVTYTDTTFTPTRMGVGTYNTTANFDNFIVSWADPRYVNVTVTLDGSPVDGWTVELYNSTGGLVASATTDAQGVAVLDVTWQPIVSGAVFKIYNSTGALVAEAPLSLYTGVDTAYGGNTYNISLKTVYKLSLISYTNASTDAVKVGAAAVFTANTSSSYTVSIYNWDTSLWTPLASGTAAQGETVSLEKLLPAAGLVADNGTVKIRLTLYSDTPLSATVDMLNSIYIVYRLEQGTYLVVAVGGTGSIEVYRDTGTSLQYLYTIPASTTFNASATIAVNPANSTIILVNTTGVYTAPIQPDAKWSPVTSSCNASTLGGVEAEVVNASGTPILIVLRGGGDEYCTVDLASNTTLSTGSLSAALASNITLDPTLAYPASAATGHNETAYFLAYNQTSTTPVILKADATPTGAVAWSPYATAPGSRSTGLAATPTALWILLERGSLYRVTPTSTILVNETLPIVPWGPGDRLEDYNTTHLLWIRADDTREAWLIEKS